MSSHPGWLPELILLGDFGGNWEPFEAALYSCFRKDFVINPPPGFDGKRFSIRRRMIDGREQTYWHLVSEGDVEDDRTPDLRRCERIAWPRPIILSAPGSDVRCWRNSNRGQSRIVIAIDDFSYVVILANRPDHVLLLTAFCVEQQHRRQKFAKEFDAAMRDGAAL